MRKAASLGALAAVLTWGSIAEAGEGACWRAFAPAEDASGLVTQAAAAAALDRAFLRMDANGDGVVSAREFSDCMLDTGALLGQFVAPRRSQKRFAEIDANGDGYVGLAEYVTMAEALFAQAADGEGKAQVSRYVAVVAEQGSGLPDREGDERVSGAEAALDVVRSFALMDVDGDGRISRLEWATVTERSPFARAFGDWDLNGDGILTSDEMHAAWAARVPSGPVSVWAYAQAVVLPASIVQAEGAGSAVAGASRR